MNNRMVMPPRGVEFRLPEPDALEVVVAEAIPEPLLPAVSSRMLHYPEHMAAVVKDLPKDHPAKTLGVFEHIETRINNFVATASVIQKESKAKLVAATGFGIAGLSFLGDGLLSGAFSHAPFAIVAGLGVLLGTGSLRKTWALARTQRQDEQDRKLETQPKRRILSSGRTVNKTNPATQEVIAKNVQLPNDADLQAKIDAALNIQLPDVAAINAVLPDWAKLAHIPGAVIKMGNDGSKRSDEGPEFTAVVSPFLVMEAAVSNAAFREFENSHNSGSELNDDDLPAVEVTLTKAQDFVAFMNKTRPVPGMKWRLQREAEKDLIMRNGDLETIIDKPSQTQVNWGGKNKTLKVKDPKFKGRYVYHYRGNVWEWCEDGYGNYPSGVVINYRGVKNSSTFVLRGASWSSVGNGVRAAFRGGSSAGNHDGNVGFRLVLAPETAEP